MVNDSLLLFKTMTLWNFDLLWKNYGTMEINLRYYGLNFGTMEKNFRIPKTMEL